VSGPEKAREASPLPGPSVAIPASARAFRKRFPGSKRAPSSRTKWMRGPPLSLRIDIAYFPDKFKRFKGV
jgi:hypothetical protein